MSDSDLDMNNTIIKALVADRNGWDTFQMGIYIKE